MENAAPAADEPEFTYRPLVARGEDRKARLAEVIERWATETPAWPNANYYSPIDLDIYRSSSSVIVGYDIRDDNDHADPIDLGLDLLSPLADRIRELHGDGKPFKLQVVVAVLDCRVAHLNVEGRTLPFHLLLAGEYARTYQSNWRDTTFLGATCFKETKFADSPNFFFAKFHRKADFSNAEFYGGADFTKATFRGPASFAEAISHGRISFRYVDFVEGADFNRAKLGNPSFRGAVFKSSCYFNKTSATSRIRFDDADLRRARIAYKGSIYQDFPVRDRIRSHTTDWLNWQWIRSFGKLTAFTKTSYLALAAVPLLAGLWGPLRRGITWINGALADTDAKLDRVLELIDDTSSEVPREAVGPLEDIGNLLSGTLPETMPIGWLLAFLAAFAVVLAQLVYQLWAPELIREASEDEWVERANERNRVDGEITDERLREAIGYLHETAERLPHRHNAWFVRRHTRTVWIPNKLEHFESATIEEPKPDDAPPDWQPEMIDAPDQEVLPDDRKRIAIEEGQRARYAAAAFEARTAAWWSGGLYVLAFWFLAMIVFRQLAYVADAAAAPKLLSGLFYCLSWGPLVGLGAEVIILATVFGALVVEEPRLWNWGVRLLGRLWPWRGREAGEAGAD